MENRSNSWNPQSQISIIRRRTACKLQDDAMMMMYSMTVLDSCWLCLLRWVLCSWPCGIHGNERHPYVVCVHNFLLLCRLFVRYHVCLPTHLLTNTALYCTMTTLKSLSRLDDHQEDEICSHLACLPCRGTFCMMMLKIHRHAVAGVVTKFLSVCVCVCVCTSATCYRYLYLFFLFA
jgi:hypothetical protein